jgi:hypothetical protein
LALGFNDFIHVGGSGRASVLGAQSEANFRNGRQWVHSERRKNAGRFPVPHENHQRFVAAGIAGLRKWQQVARVRNGRFRFLFDAFSSREPVPTSLENALPRNKKGRREAGLFEDSGLRRNRSQ